MYTVTVTRTTAQRPADPARASRLQYPTLDTFAAAHSGTLQVGTTIVSYRRCRTRASAWWQVWRVRRSGATATITHGDRRAGQAKARRILAGTQDKD